MLSLRLRPNSPNGPQHRRLRRAGFTIAEVLAGVTILGLVASSVIYGLNQLNRYATVNRLYTQAQVLAQNHIDLILTMGPYDPSQGKYPTPANCGEASATNTILRTDVPYYYDPTIGLQTCAISTTEKKLTLYNDPMSPSEAATVQCTVRTRVTDTGASVTVNGVVTPLDLRRATVEVAYTFRSRPYKIVMETMRTTDQ